MTDGARSPAKADDHAAGDAINRPDGSKSLAAPTRSALSQALAGTHRSSVSGRGGVTGRDSILEPAPVSAGAATTPSR
jgi:hypothetical protein